jgi:hypothetical protein
VRAARLAQRGQIAVAIVTAMGAVVVALVALLPKGADATSAAPPTTGPPTAASGAAASSPVPAAPSLVDLAPAGGCVPAGLPESRQGRVVPLVGAGSPVSAGPAAYVLRSADGPQLEIGGELRGVVPPDRTVVFFSWGDPGTKDTLDQRGDGNFYLSDSFRISGSCYYRDAFKIAYPGAEGITFRIYVALLPSARLEQLRKNNSDYGYTRGKLDQLGVTDIAYVVVPTG